MGLAFAGRVPGWGDAWLNPDEGTYYLMATWPSGADFRAELAANAHPPLFYVLERGLGWLTHDYLWLRAPALVFGVAAVVGIFLATRRLAGEKAAVLAALLAALAPGLVVHSRLIRPYTLQLALLSFALWLLLRFLQPDRGEGRGRDLAACSALLCAAVLTHYASVVEVLACAALAGAVLAARGSARRDAPRVALALAAPLLVFALLYVFHARAVSGSPIAEAARSQLARLLPRDAAGMARGWLGVHLYVFGPRLGSLALLLSSLGLAAAAVTRRTALAAFAAAALLSSAALGTLGLYPFGASRHSLHLALALVPCAAVGLEALLLRGARRAAVAGVPLAALALFPGPLGALLGAPSHVIPVETPVRASAVRPIADALERARDAGGILLVDGETSRVLAPLLAGLGTRVPATLEPGVSSFAWGHARLLVAHPWRLLAGREAIANPLHAAGFLRFLATARPELHLASRSDGLLLFAGWGAYLYRALPEANERLGAACFEDLHFRGGAGSARVDFARCLAALERLPARAAAPAGAARRRASTSGPRALR